MPQVLYVDATDEISDVIESVRRSSDNAVALVLPDESRVFNTPLNFKLLSQFSSSSDKTTSLVTGNSRLQRLGHEAGFHMFASVPAFERGIEVVHPHEDGPTAALTGVPQSSAVGGAVKSPLPPNPRVPGTGASGDKRRGPLFVGIAIAVIGFLGLVFVSPSAGITLAVAATPISVTPQIQGSTSPVNGQQDYVQTKIVTAQDATPFTATPSGSQQLPSTQATGSVAIETDLPTGAFFKDIPQGTEFDTSSNPPIKFYSTQDIQNYTVPAPSSGQKYSAPGPAIPVQDGTAETKGNVSAGAINIWPGNPCGPNGANKSSCSSSDLTVSNSSPTTGGADAKTVTSASDSDIQNWNNQVSSIKQTLTGKVQSDMKAHAGSEVFAIQSSDDPQHTGVPSVSCAISPAIPTSGAPFSSTQITVTCQSSGVAYNPGDVRAQVLHDLNAAKPANEQLVASNCNIPNPQTNQVSPDGTLALDFPGSGVTCFSTPPIQGSELASQLACKSPDDAKQLLQNANNRRLQSIDIKQSPFGLFFLPCLSSRISVNVSYIQGTPSGK